MKSQTLILKDNAKDFRSMIEDHLKDGWLIAPESLTIARTHDGSTYACIVEKELREIRHFGPR